MSVARELGLVEGAIPEILAESWQRWAEKKPELLAVDDWRSLRRWLLSSDPAEADRVLQALVWLASVEGGDDVDAALVMAWALLPGARNLACDLRTLTAGIDAEVAAELWLQIRGVSWEGRQKIAAHVLRRVRRGVLADCDAPAYLRSHDPTWHHTITTVNGPEWMAAPKELSPLEELLDVLGWACDEGVISEEDRRLLLCAVRTAELGEPSIRCSRTYFGLLARDLVRAVAVQWAVSEKTVQRRLTRALNALQAAAHGYTRIA